ncbi:hypothetical protein J6590_007249 [Homalodisca vitripennis]|nr:hypothetical protein J6590_007249 [Homalodisca vitripennis]
MVNGHHQCLGSEVSFPASNSQKEQKRQGKILFTYAPSCPIVILRKKQDIKKKDGEAVKSTLLRAVKRRPENVSEKIRRPEKLHQISTISRYSTSVSFPTVTIEIDRQGWVASADLELDCWLFLSDLTSKRMYHHHRWNQRRGFWASITVFERLEGIETARLATSTVIMYPLPHRHDQ